MSYLLGRKVRLRATFTDPSTGLPADPTLVGVKIQDPSGTESSAAATKDPAILLGSFYYDLVLDAVGVWTWRIEGSGAVVAVEEGSLEVKGSAFVEPEVDATQHITIADLNQFSDGSRIAFTTVDQALEATYAAEILGKLSLAYTTAEWLNSATTPTLVRSIIAALVVAQEYERRYSEDSGDEGWYPDKLRKWAYGLVEAIVGGTITLPDIEVPVDSLLNSAVGFFPNDLAETDGLGNETRFSMRMAF